MEAVLHDHHFLCPEKEEQPPVVKHPSLEFLEETNRNREGVVHTSYFPHDESHRFFSAPDVGTNKVLTSPTQILTNHEPILNNYELMCFYSTYTTL